MYIFFFFMVLYFLGDVIIEYVVNQNNTKIGFFLITITVIYVYYRIEIVIQLIRKKWLKKMFIEFKSRIILNLISNYWKKSFFSSCYVHQL